jgi:glycosyltransferase involved in cell wall biosynthesis
VGCAEDLVLQGRTGAVVPCGDVAALAGAMASMAADPAAARRMGAEARRRVESHFSIGSAARGIRQGLALALAP